MVFLAAFQSVSVLFILIIIGIIVGKKGLVSEKSQAEITNLVVYITLPATILKSMMREISSEAVSNIIVGIIIIAIAYVLLYIVSDYISKKFSKLTLAQKDVLLIGSIQGNISFMGYPVILAVFGDEVLFYAAICHGFLFELLSWVVAINVFERNVDETKKKINIKQILLRPSIIAIIVGLAFFITQYKPSYILTNVINMLSSATSPLAMMLVGIMLSRADIHSALKNKYLYISSVLKLLIFPLIIYGVVVLLPIPNVLIKTIVIEFAMPTAAYTAIQSASVNNDSKLASQLIFVSSLFSIITLPFIITILG